MTDPTAGSPPRLDLDAIENRAVTRTPEQTAARQARLDAWILGRDAMTIGEHHLAAGDLARAHEFFTIAARHNATDAHVMLNTVNTLINAANDPEITSITTGTVLAFHQADSHADRDLSIQRAQDLAQRLDTVEAHLDLMTRDADAAAAATIRNAAATVAGLLVLERPSPGTSQAQTHHLPATPTHIDSAPQQSPIESPPPAKTPTPSPEPTNLLNYLEALVSPAVAGDPEAVGRLLTTIRPLVVQYCRVRIGRAEQSLARADDVAQEACLAVLTALPRYRSQGRPFLAFVYGITAHKVADAQRVRGRDQRESAPMSDAERDQTTANIDQMLSGLTPRQRDILILRIVIGLSAEETAEAVGSTPGAVRVAQHRALARLRKTTNLNTTNR